MVAKIKDYRVGHLEHFREDDPLLDGYDEAIEFAKQYHKYDDLATGIWTGPDSDSDLIAIYYGRELFVK